MKKDKNDMVSSKSKSLKYAKRNIKTGTDFACFMSALMSDLIEGKVTPQIANASCNAGGKLLKVVEMQHRYGKQIKGSVDKDIVLLN